MSTRQLWLFLVLVLCVSVVVSEIRTNGEDDVYYDEPRGTCGALLDETSRQMYEDTGTYLTPAERADIRSRSPRCD